MSESSDLNVIGFWRAWPLETKMASDKEYYLKVFKNFVVASITRLYYHRSLSVVI